MKKKIDLEYILNSSPNVLYSRLSTASGLAEWFADNVTVKGKIFTFIWEGTEQTAELVGYKNNKYARFHWLDDEDENSYFEFRINIDEITGDVALLITDFVEEDEKEDSIDLWDTQIAQLKHVIGL
ncbi:MAG: SRPBCC domain-containing protein [Bacteroidetes bacterium]|nr:SRPBCC domain-containing protein [Bacteroidota bacterium]